MPVPPWSVPTVPFVVKFLEASVKTALEAPRPGILIELTVKVPVEPLSAKVSRLFVPSVIARVPVLPIETTGAVLEKEIGVAEE